jgi:hypothetical protein
VSSVSAKVSSILLVASLLTMMGGPLLAASPHEVCDAMRHACDKIDALASCCCGDRSDNNPLRAPAAQIDLGSASHAAIVTVPAALLVVTVVLLPKEPLTSARPPDLPILFSDLRI